MESGVTISVDNTRKLKKTLKDMITPTLYVGIPEDSANNKRVNDLIPNSVLGYLIEYGETYHNLPPRPFLIPGVIKAIGDSDAVMINAAKDALLIRGNTIEGITRALTDVGVAAVMNAQEFCPEDTGQLKDAITFEVVKND